MHTHMHELVKLSFAGILRTLSDPAHTQGRSDGTAVPPTSARYQKRKGMYDHAAATASSESPVKFLLSTVI